MIIYIFNNYFPDNSGFGKRCQKEIEILSQKHDVVVMCRRRNEENLYEERIINSKKVIIYRYNINAKPIERVDQSYLSVFYEIKRNFELMLGFISTLIKIIWKNRNIHDKKMYVVVSPLTVPFFALLVSRIMNTKPYVIEFHDLEPELAMHIKNISMTSLVMKIELFLEKLLCRVFSKVIVTNNTQAERLVQRTGISADKVTVIPNSLQVNEATVSKDTIREKFKFKPNDFLVGYISNFSYDYTVKGLIELIDNIGTKKTNMKNTKIVLVGDGDGLEFIKKSVHEYQLEQCLVMLGRVDNPEMLLSVFDVCMIPWLQDTFSETVLPTKLFEYMKAQKAVIAPNFGEFKKLIDNRKSGMLFNTIEELYSSIIYLKSNYALVNMMGKEARTIYFKKYRSQLFERKILEYAD